jgi:hypothetical protein
MGGRFRDWLGCPVCEERRDVSMMAHRTDIVLECYGCGEMAEFTIGRDISIHGLDVDAITDVVEK